MKSCVFAGTFDPVTLGHAETVERCLKIFDRVYVGLLKNPDKRCLFTEEERLAFLRKTFEEESAVTVLQWDGLLVDFMKETGASVYVRGIRNETDYRYETENYKKSLSLDPSLLTVYIPSAAQNEGISSTEVKRLLQEGKDVSRYLPEKVVALVTERYREK